MPTVTKAKPAVRVRERVAPEVVAEQERLDALTFPERIDEVKKGGYSFERQDATGQKDDTRVRQLNNAEVQLVIIKDEEKFISTLNEVTKGPYAEQASAIATKLGVKFEQKELDSITSEDESVREAQIAAERAGGRFVPGK